MDLIEQSSLKWNFELFDKVLIDFTDMEIEYPINNHKLISLGTPLLILVHTPFVMVNLGSGCVDNIRSIITRQNSPIWSQLLKKPQE